MMHPSWAQHAMIVPYSGTSDEGRSACCSHALENCPSGMSFGLRHLTGQAGNAWEWFAPATPEHGIHLDKDEADLVRVWFDAVHDLNSVYLDGSDFALARRIYERLGLRVPGSLGSRIAIPTTLAKSILEPVVVPCIFVGGPLDGQRVSEDQVHEKQCLAPQPDSNHVVMYYPRSWGIAEPTPVKWVFFVMNDVSEAELEERARTFLKRS